MTPAVLLHGVGLDAAMWEPVRAASRRPTYAYDLLGLGAAAGAPGPYALASYVDQFAREAPAGTVDVVGFSMGALVAQAVALASPERVRRLVLVSGVYDRSPAERSAILARVDEVRSGGYVDTIETAIERWFTPAFVAEHPALVDVVRQRMLTNDIAAYADAYHVFATADADLAPQVGRIGAPTLVITGADDPRSTPRMTRRLAAALPDGRAVVMPGQRHLIPVEAPLALAAMIDEFLDVESGEGEVAVDEVEEDYSRSQTVEVDTSPTSMSDPFTMR